MPGNPLAPLESRRLFAAGALGFAFPLAGTGDEHVTAQATDAAGNLYVALRLDNSDTVDLNPSPRKSFNLTADANGDYALAKYSPAGGLFWAKLLPGQFSEGLTVAGLAIDRKSGDLLLAGSFVGAVTLAPGVSLASAENSADGYWARASAATGAVTFAARGVSTENADALARIATDAAGNVYVAGTTGGLLLDDNTFTHQDSASLAKYSAKGKFIWGTGWRPQSDDGNLAAPTALAVTAAGQVYVAGLNNGTGPTDFDRDPATTADRVTGVASYLASFDTAGKFQFVGALTFPGPLVDSPWPTITGLASDPAGNVLAVGSFQGTTDFNFSSKIVTLSTGAGRDGFLAKYAPTGKLFYAKQIGADADATGQDAASSVAVDSQGYAYVGGTFAGLTYFNPGVSSFRFRPTAGQDAFVAKYQANGTFLTAWQLAGTGDDDVSFLTAAPGKSAPIFAAGRLTGTLDADPGPNTFLLTTADGYDAFLLKLA